MKAVVVVRARAAFVDPATQGTLTLCRELGAAVDAVDVAALYALIRQALTLANIPYQVVYGSGKARLHNALRCLGVNVSTPNDDILESGPTQLKNWQCERCSDPNCEHRLFTRLL